MKKIVSVFLIFVTGSFIFAQTTAKALADESCKKDGVEQSISYLEKNISSLKDAKEKRSSYVYLASIQEKMGRYSEAQKNYAEAAAIAAGDADGMPKRSSEQLVLDAIRCALCAGDYETAQTYLNSAVRSSKNETVTAYVKLYEQWALLVKAETIKDTEEVVAILKTYSELKSMKSVHPQILLTLWHVTGEKSYSDKLQKSFAGTPEEAIVSGKIQMKPSPFWYFVPRSGEATPEVTNASSSKPVTADAPVESKTEKQDSKTAKNKVTKQQLGLFKDKANAENLVKRLKEKGFTGNITSEVRPSGTTYYIVCVSENKTGTIGDELRTAGFECYPVFE